MSEKLIKLETWAENVYGDDAPSIYTLRRWVKFAKIVPAPKKHGGKYYVVPSARFLDYNDPEYSSAMYGAS